MTAQHAPGIGAGRPPYLGHPLYHPDLRENHRFLADRLAQLAQFVEPDACASHTGADDRAYLRGYQAALRDLTRHLSAGDYLPGGLLNYPNLLS